MKILRYVIVLVVIVSGGLWLANHLMATESVEVDKGLRQGAPGKLIKLSAGETHYSIEGPEDGEIVVLAAGATLPMWVWKDLDKRLINAGYRVLKYDYYGRGYSDRPDLVYNLELYSKQLDELTTSLIPNKKFHIVNLAFGSLVASDYLVRHPKKVISMIGIGPDGFGLEAPTSTRILLQLPKPVVNYIFSTLGTNILMARIPKYSKDAGVIKELQALYRPELNRKGFKRALLSTVFNTPVGDSQELYHKVTATGIPVQMVWGAYDIVTPFPGNERVKNVLPNADIQIYDEMGHLPQFDRPEMFAGKIIAFLKKVRETRE
ncbi:MAG: alpha/beta fold hydrolase [Methyloligellaceae bacterium]